MNDEQRRALSKAIQERGKRPASEQFEDMVRRGAIDREGNVTLRRPEGPVANKAAGKNREKSNPPS